MKTSELSGVQLDYAVDLVEGGYADYLKRHAYAETKNSEYIEREPREPLTFRDLYGTPTCPRYSTDWAIAGPIIERERIELRGDGDEGWIACDNLNPEQTGTTPLEAAMRCYVTSKLGEEVGIPEELK